MRANWGHVALDRSCRKTCGEAYALPWTAITYIPNDDWWWCPWWWIDDDAQSEMEWWPFQNFTMYSHWQQKNVLLMPFGPLPVSNVDDFSSNPFARWHWRYWQHPGTFTVTLVLCSRNSELKNKLGQNLQSRCRTTGRKMSPNRLQNSAHFATSCTTRKIKLLWTEVLGVGVSKLAQNYFPFLWILQCTIQNVYYANTAFYPRKEAEMLESQDDCLFRK